MGRRAFGPARVVLGRAWTMYVAWWRMAYDILWRLRGLTSTRIGGRAMPSWSTIDEHGVWHHLAVDGRDGVTCHRALP